MERLFRKTERLQFRSFGPQRLATIVDANTPKKVAVGGQVTGLIRFSRYIRGCRQTSQPATRAEYAAEFLSAENQPENMRRAASAAVFRPP
jgi:hypothetical protein